MPDDLGPAAPTPPIDLAGGAAAVTDHLGATRVEVPDALVERLATICPVDADPAALGEAGRDWWPLAMTWALDGQVGGRAGLVARPTNAAQVADVLRVCNEAGVPVTAAAGRSGVCGGSVPVHGGVVLDLCGLSGIVGVDDTSMLLDVLPGTFGDHLEAELRATHGVTLGHWPQSIALSTVGGWLACRSAGQLSNRYGKIEDMVVGLDVVLADGRTIHTGGSPRSAVGPDLNQVFVGSEGTLGIIVGSRLRLHPAPAHERRGAWGFASFADGLDACRRILRRGGRPAVLRLYDTVESDRNFSTGDAHHVLLALDEGDPAVVDGSWAVVAEECAGADPLDESLVETWMGHRNDVSALERLISGGLVVDTMEISGPWATLPTIYEQAVAAIKGVEGALAASAHQSHAYPDGACLYFTFAGAPAATDPEAYYRAVWDAGTAAALAGGARLSHHHGVGLNRARFLTDALGPTVLDVHAAVKHALDPAGVLPTRFGPEAPTWP